MSQKGVAVPYIIAIVLGIVVIGLIGYWLFISGGNFGTTSANTQCKEKLLIYCTKLFSSGSATWDYSATCDTVLKINAVTIAQSLCPTVGITILGTPPPPATPPR